MPFILNFITILQNDLFFINFLVIYDSILISTFEKNNKNEI